MALVHALLAVVAESTEPLHGHAIARRLAGLLDGIRPVNPGQVYATLRRVTRDGSIAHTAARGAARGRFELRPAGRAELARWLETPAATTPPPCGFVARLVVASALGDRATIARLLAARRIRCIEVRRALDRGGACGGSTLVTDAARRHLAAELAWLDDAEDALVAAGSARPDAPRT